MKLKLYFLVSMALFLCRENRVFSQIINFDLVSPPKGISWGVIVGITQDTQGYLWLASAFNGVFKYDGYQITHYLKDPLDQNSINSNRVECIYADSHGIIWIGTFNGLDRFDPTTNKFTHFFNSSDDHGSISNIHITAILEDREGNLWVGTDSGLSKLNKLTGKFTSYHHNDSDLSSMTNGAVRVLYEDRRGILWIGCGDPSDEECKSDCGGFNRFERQTGKFTRYIHDPADSNSIADNRVRAVLEDSHGNFWIGTAGKDGLYLMNRSTGEFRRQIYDPKNQSKLSRPPTKKYQFQDDHITFITEDKVGDIWIGSLLAGLSRYDVKTQKIYRFSGENRKNGYSDTTCWWAYRSREGALWLSTWQGNLFKVDPYHNYFRHVNLDKYVSSIQEDSAGILWLGTNQGLIRFDPTSGKKQQFLYDGHNDNYIHDIHIDKSGRLWIGSGDGIYNFNRQFLTYKRYQHDPKDSRTISKSAGPPFLEDDQGYLWMTTDSGFDRMDLQTEVFQHFSNNSNIKRDRVSSLEKDKNGNFWIGTWGAGVYRLNPYSGSFSHYLPNANVACILPDQEGTVWVGTDAALYFSKDFSLFSPYRLAETELPVNGIASLLEDDQKNLWINAQRGIIRLNPLRNKMDIYDANYGVFVPNFNWLYSRNFPSCKGQFGEIFFGDESGFYTLSPRELKRNPYQPQIIISKFILQNEKPKPLNDSQSNGLPISTNQIVLSYKQNAFSIHFVGIHYSSPMDNRHFFILENYDQRWRQSGSEHSANYYNVPAGKYVFRVKASSSDGVWAERSVTIIINPPWWRTWWAYSMYVFFIGIAVFLFDWQQKKRVIEKIREQGRERELEMQALRSQMNPHFIFNCLSSINNFIMKNETEEASDYLTKFSRLIRNVLTNSKKNNISLEEEIETLRLYLEMEKLRFKGSFTYCIHMEEIIDPSVIFIPPLLFQPFAENAVWHGLLHKSDPGRLDIRVKIEKNILICIIEDNGVGRSFASQYESKSVEKKKSMGIQITRQRLSLINGNEEIVGNDFVIEDLFDDTGHAAGTKVILRLMYKETND